MFPVSCLVSGISSIVGTKWPLISAMNQSPVTLDPRAFRVRKAWQGMKSIFQLTRITNLPIYKQQIANGLVPGVQIQYTPACMLDTYMDALWPRWRRGRSELPGETMRFDAFLAEADAQIAPGAACWLGWAPWARRGRSSESSKRQPLLGAVARPAAEVLEVAGGGRHA